MWHGWGGEGVVWSGEGSTNNMMLWHNIILLVELVGWCVACGVALGRLY